MAVVAAAGLMLLDAGRFGGLGTLTAAVVALAVGGPVEASVAPAGLPVTVQGLVHVMPLGVSLVGAVVLGVLLLRRGTAGLFVRGAAAVAAFVAGLGAVAWLGRGTLSSGVSAGSVLGAPGCAANGGLPFGGGSLDSGSLDAGFSVTVGSTLAGAAGWALAVVGVCWLTVRFRVAAGMRVVLWAVGGLTVVGVLAGWVFGGAAAAGAVLLVLPVAVFGVLLLGLGVPWTVSADGMLSCALATPLSPGGPLVWVSGAVLLGCGIVFAARTSGRSALWLGPIVGVVLAVMALLSRVSVRLGVDAFGFSLPVLDARLAANPLLALAVGLAGGAVAGLAGDLLVRAFRRRVSVFWPAWNRVRR